MSEINDVLQKIAELTETVKEHGADPATVDYERLEGDFKALLDEHRQALLKELPDRQGAFSGEGVAKRLGGYKGKYARELRDIVEHGKHKIGNYEVRGSDLVMAKMLLDQANNLKATGIGFQGSDRVAPTSPDLNAAVKMLTADGATTGDELVPTGMAAELWQDFFTASLIAADLPNQPMPSDPFDMPLGLGDVTWRKGGQGIATAATNVATAKSTLTATEQICEVDWSYNLDEDAVVAMMPALRQRLTISGGEQMDAFVLNADATASASSNINLGDGTPDADAYYLSAGQDGIRHLYLVDNTSQASSGGGDALADADIVGALNKLDKYGTDLANVRIVPGIAAYFAMMGLTNVATVDKYGPQATIVRGELARYRGVPILPSASMAKSLNTGKVSATAGSNTYGNIALYNRNFWRVGFRRGLLIEVDRNIQNRQLIMVVSMRIAVAAHGTRSSAQHTSGIYNFTV